MNARTRYPQLAQVNDVVHGSGVVAEARQVLTEIDALYALVADFTDPDDCSLDHHGYCQAHHWLTEEGTCPHARAKLLLGRDPGFGRTTVVLEPDGDRHEQAAMLRRLANVLESEV